MFESTKSNREGWPSRGRRAAAVATALGVVLTVFATATESAAEAEPTPIETPVETPIETQSTVPAPPPNTLPPEPTHEAQILPIESTSATSGQPLLVPDPRSGDLRLEPAADLLAADYEPDVEQTILDVAYGPLEVQRLDFHLPAGVDAPLIAYLHSGGWVGGDRIHVPDFVLRFVERGYAVASIGYRLAPDHPFPAPVHDIKLAIRWLKSFAADSPLVDADDIILVGASAGGHLAAFTAATVGTFEPETGPELAGFDSSVAAVAVAVGPTDLTTFYGHDHPWAAPLTEAFLGCSPCTTTTLAQASPAAHLHTELPPAYFAVGAEDGLVDVAAQGISTADAWAQAAGPGSAWLDVVEGRGHNIDDGSINQRFLEAFVDQAVAERPADRRVGSVTQAG